MGKKCVEEFNPWPPFVDIFSSTILVLLLFMLILIVNLGYYAQFKFKVSYTGTIATSQLITEQVPEINKINEPKKKQIPIEQKEIVEQKVIKTSIISEVQEKKELERAGQDLVQANDTNSTLQATVQKDDYLIVTFADKEILLDDPTIVQVKQFIQQMKNKFPKHKVIISSVEPTNQISSTIAKQISLARTLNTRNLIRKQGYNKSDVRIRLLDDTIRSKLPENEAGFVYITVKVNK
ncbi:MAG: hypothetical protein K8R39_08430 [Arcobacteraceae bacterium]|nr:hypothetical protein [Arcobacteraceae bacterium]